jgi:hypothetical protein
MLQWDAAVQCKIPDQEKKLRHLIGVNANRHARQLNDTFPKSFRSRVAASNNKTKEVTMTTVASFRNSAFETTCAKCGEALIAPEWSEFVSGGLVLNLWTCTSCGCRFETEACIPADAEQKIDSKVSEAFFPSLLVA